ncbi:ROK family transcriptional regulator [Vallicoccus soli]|uniref:ROK family transcriptional regulator n=1 Tax=Vallicoccus soli TaxID=2339232 RepID=A0A3A3YW78_9ACTN|nr:ROK family transcriptional regulator [Vallicoccus soli]
MPVAPPLTRGPADQVAVRRTNLGVVLRHLRHGGPSSRAGVAAATGLNKATVSSLVGELVERGLLVERGALHRGTVGRPGQEVALAGGGTAGVGVEVNVGYVAAVVLDLGGRVVHAARTPLDVPRAGVDAALDEAARLVDGACAAAAAAGARPVGATVAVPGLVEQAEGRVAYAPNLRWADVPVLDALDRRLGGSVRRGLPLGVDNEANLAALAEAAVAGPDGAAHLLHLTGEVGVGAGLVVDGRLLRGAAGFGGEVGHMPLDPAGDLCGCGRRGCWETLVGLAALLRAAADPGDPVRDPSLDLEARLALLARRADAGDARTAEALARVGTALGVGASILVNVLNPRLVVLGGYFAALGEHLMPPLLDELRVRVVAPGAGGARVVRSTLGLTAAARGGAQVALDAVLDDPTLVTAPAGSGTVLTLDEEDHR